MVFKRKKQRKSRSRKTQKPIDKAVEMAAAHSRGAKPVDPAEVVAAANRLQALVTRENQQNAERMAKLDAQRQALLESVDTLNKAFIGRAAIAPTDKEIKALPPLSLKKSTREPSP